MRVGRRKTNTAVALFLVITSLIIISLAMRELLVRSSAQVDRVRNSYDRVQAFYLAKSNLALMRLYLRVQSLQTQNAGYDTLEKVPRPLPFPLTLELVQAVAALNAPEEDKEKSMQLTLPPERAKACTDFNSDFSGSSNALVEDLSARFNLNQYNGSTEVAQKADVVLNNILEPNYEFGDELQKRGIEKEKIVTQIRDYIDKDAVINPSTSPETQDYQDLENDSGPKNDLLMIADELKVLPEMNDFVFDFLKNKVAVYPPGTGVSKFNLNTVSAEVFQALLLNQGSGTADLAKQFIKDRIDNSRIYTRDKIKEQLEEAGFSDGSVNLDVVGTESEAYLVTSRATVGESEVTLEATIRNPRSSKGENSIIILRVSP